MTFHLYQDRTDYLNNDDEMMDDEIPLQDLEAEEEEEEEEGLFNILDDDYEDEDEDDFDDDDDDVASPRRPSTVSPHVNTAPSRRTATAWPYVAAICTMS